MLRHAAVSGALVFEESRVTEVKFEGSGPDARPTSALWRNKQGKTGKISFDYLIDASGRAGLVSSKALCTRKFNQSLKNIACWGYWRGTSVYSPTTSRAGSPWFEALTGMSLLAPFPLPSSIRIVPHASPLLLFEDETGWAWFIPLHNGTTSIGVVMNQEVSNSKKQRMPKDNSSLTAFYLQQLQFAPDIMNLVAEGTLETPNEGPPVRSASDYSYSASSYAGPYYRLAGDAAGKSYGTLNCMEYG